MGTAVARRGVRRESTKTCEAATVAELVELATRDNEAAWIELNTRFGRLVRSVAQGFGLNEADVAEVSQNTWMRLCESREQIREPEKVAGWLKATTRNECLNLIRRRSRERVSSDTETYGAVADVPDADHGLLVDEIRSTVLRTLRSLSDYERRLVDLLFAEASPSYANISEALGVPVGSIGPTRCRILAKLRRHPEIARLSWGPLPQAS